MSPPLSIGTYLSGAGHAALLVWMVAGWGMQSDPLPFEVTDVSIVSGSEFAALTRGVQPDLPSGGAPQIEQPSVDDTPPAPAPQTPPEVAQTPTPVAPPATETPPAAPEISVPDTVVSDAPPAVPDTPSIVTPPPSAELGQSPRPVPRAAPRVAPEIITPPDADATISPEVMQAATDQTDAPMDETVELAEETTAPEAATDQIITEAETPEFAPEISRRPQTRPVRTAAVPEATPAAEPDSAPAAEMPREDEIDPVTAALAAAGAVETPAPAPNPAPAPTPGLGGGELSDGDKSGFLRQIGACWNTGSMSTAAQNTIIEMAFDMTPDGKPVSTSINLESFSGGSAEDAEVALDYARRALLRCSGDAGYDLPPEQYAQWQRVILTVDPTAMSQR